MKKANDTHELPATGRVVTRTWWRDGSHPYPGRLVAEHVDRVALRGGFPSLMGKSLERRRLAAWNHASELKLQGRERERLERLVDAACADGDRGGAR